MPLEGKGGVLFLGGMCSRLLSPVLRAVLLTGMMRMQVAEMTGSELSSLGLTGGPAPVAEASMTQHQLHEGVVPLTLQASGAPCGPTLRWSGRGMSRPSPDASARSAGAGAGGPAAAGPDFL